MSQPSYILDSNIFIEAARRYYPLDFARPFWDGLVTFAKNQQIGTCDKVYDEILEGSDILSDWMSANFDDFVSSTETEEVLENYARVVQWADEQAQYTTLAKEEFMHAKNADAWLIAFCLSHDVTLVTHETFDSQIRKRILIPNVCEAFGIPYCDTFEMLRRLKFSF